MISILDGLVGTVRHEPTTALNCVRHSAGCCSRAATSPGTCWWCCSATPCCTCCSTWAWSWRTASACAGTPGRCWRARRRPGRPRSTSSWPARPTGRPRPRCRDTATTSARYARDSAPAVVARLSVHADARPCAGDAVLRQPRPVAHAVGRGAVPVVQRAAHVGRRPVRRQALRDTSLLTSTPTPRPPIKHFYTLASFFMIHWIPFFDGGFSRWTSSILAKSTALSMLFPVDVATHTGRAIFRARVSVAGSQCRKLNCEVAKSETRLQLG